MAYLIAFLLLTLNTGTYEASTPDGVECTEVRAELMDFISDGSLTIEQVDEIVDRCIATYS